MSTQTETAEPYPFTPGDAVRDVADITRQVVTLERINPKTLACGLRYPSEGLQWVPMSRLVRVLEDPKRDTERRELAAAREWADDLRVSQELPPGDIGNVDALVAEVDRLTKEGAEFARLAQGLIETMTPDATHAAAVEALKRCAVAMYPMTVLANDLAAAWKAIPSEYREGLG